MVSHQQNLKRLFRVVRMGHMISLAYGLDNSTFYQANYLVDQLAKTGTLKCSQNDHTIELTSLKVTEADLKLFCIIFLYVYGKRNSLIKK